MDATRNLHDKCGALLLLKSGRFGQSKASHTDRGQAFSILLHNKQHTRCRGFCITLHSTVVWCGWQRSNLSSPLSPNPIHLIFSKMSQDPVLTALIAESQREADEKAYKKHVIQEIIKLRKRLGLGKDQPNIRYIYMYDVQKY